MSAALIIDDNPINQKVLQLYLKSYVSTLDWALTANSGLEKLAESRYDYVLVDIHLPDLNGIELAQKVREAEQYKDRFKYLIAITGDRSVEDDPSAQQVFNGILIKPFTRNKLIKLLGSPQSNGDRKINLNSILPLLETHADKAQFFNLLQKSLRHFHDQLKNPEVSGNLENVRALVHKVEPVFKMIDQLKYVEEVRKYYTLPDSTRVKTLSKVAESVVPLLQEAQQLASGVINNMSEQT
ncbi:response regulator [bacterium]|nr:MAG: response regulator [bacterium]